MKDLGRLQQEWYAKARASGFVDIEAPSGMISRPRAVRPDRPTGPARAAAQAEHLERARAWMQSHQFVSELDRLIWEAHCAEVSARQIAREMGLYRKKVDQTISRLTREMNGAPKRRGRPRNDDSLRSEGLRYELRLTPRTQLALDHIRSVVGPAGAANVARKAIEDAARKISARTIK